MGKVKCLSDFSKSIDGSIGDGALIKWIEIVDNVDMEIEDRGQVRDGDITFEIREDLEGNEVTIVSIYGDGLLARGFLVDEYESGEFIISAVWIL